MVLVATPLANRILWRGRHKNVKIWCCKRNRISNLWNYTFFLGHPLVMSLSLQQRNSVIVRNQKLQLCSMIFITVSTSSPDITAHLLPKSHKNSSNIIQSHLKSPNLLTPPHHPVSTASPTLLPILLSQLKSISSLPRQVLFWQLL